MNYVILLLIIFLLGVIIVFLRKNPKQTQIRQFSYNELKETLSIEELNQIVNKLKEAQSLIHEDKIKESILTIQSLYQQYDQAERIFKSYRSIEILSVNYRINKASAQMTIQPDQKDFKQIKEEIMVLIEEELAHILRIKDGLNDKF